MTLILAIGCSEGAVLAADSASSDLVHGVKHSVTKLKQLGERSIIWGGAGDVGLLQKIEVEIEDLEEGAGTLTSQCKFIRKHVADAHRDSREFHVPFPSGDYQLPARADVIFVFPYGQKAHILNIDTDCKDWLVTAEHGEFLALGSGAQLAQALFRLHLSGTRTLEEGKVIAYRILDDAIEIAAYGLGHPINVWAITANGEVHKLDDDKLDALKQSSELWRQREREALASALSPPPRLEEIPTFAAQQE
jgi:20S proteasome alpha/beta subunit